MSYKHITTEQREIIFLERNKGATLQKISAISGLDKSSISRELKRNGGIEVYRPTVAATAYLHRREACSAKPKLISGKLRETVLAGLRSHWSPEQIVNRDNLALSFSTIYRSVKTGVLPFIAVNFLRRKGAVYNYNDSEKRGKFSGFKSIDSRPSVVAESSRIGDWEGDTIVGKNNRGAILTLVDRKSSFLITELNANRKAGAIQAMIVDSIGCYPCYTITVDNGKEFARFADIENDTGSEVYFAHPHSPWERGLNENTNGLLREFVPKKTDFATLSNAYIQQITALINNRPRKSLNWFTPAEIFFDNTSCCT
jgi:IS30 family transposase